MTTQIPDLSISDLRDAISGRVLTADDPDYDQARTVTLGDIDDRPAAIIKVATADDVVRAIASARTSGLELAVRSGGHSGAGHSTTEGGIVIDVSDMKRSTSTSTAGPPGRRPA